LLAVAIRSASHEGLNAPSAVGVGEIGVLNISYSSGFGVWSGFLETRTKVTYSSLS